MTVSGKPFVEANGFFVLFKPLIPRAPKSPKGDFAQQQNIIRLWLSNQRKEYY